MHEQQRRELTHATVSLVEQREIVKLFRLGERLRFSDGRFKLGPWQHGFDSGKGGVAPQLFEVRQVLHGTLGAFAGELKPIVLVNPRGALGLDAASANQTQSFDQLWKIAWRGRISGLPQPRQRALSAPDADLEQLIQ